MSVCIQLTPAPPELFTPPRSAPLQSLKLQQIPDCLDHLAEQAASNSWTYVEFLDHLLQAEMRGRSDRDVALKTRMTRFPFVKTLDQFQ